MNPEQREYIEEKKKFKTHMDTIRIKNRLGDHEDMEGIEVEIRMWILRGFKILEVEQHQVR